MARDRFNWVKGKWGAECIACKALRCGLMSVVGTPVSDLKKDNLCEAHRESYENWEFSEVGGMGEQWPTQ